uniref:ankyrin repeat domain-containing protein n=1 Tax=Oceanithermus sp. TaxID=2268145 RepID=UPI0025E815D0
MKHRSSSWLLVLATVYFGAVAASGQRLLDHEFWARADYGAVYFAIVRMGEDVNQRDGFGVTPLHLAAANSADPAVIRLLLEHGARVG